MKVHRKEDLAFIQGEYRLVCECGEDFYSKSKGFVYDQWEEHLEKTERDHDDCRE